MVYGFIGVGTINSAVATGLLTVPGESENVVLSPRNAEKAEALRQRFPDRVTVAIDNQAVIDQSNLVFVAVLPSQAETMLSTLSFGPDHTVVSLMAGVSLDVLEAMLVAVGVSRDRIARAIPLPPVAHHAGVTVVCPDHPDVVRLFNVLGTAVAVDDETMMSKLCVITCTMGAYYQFLDTCHSWLVENGVDACQASVYTGALLHSIACDGKSAGAAGFQKLIAEQTPGGFNEMGIRELREAGVWDELRATLTSISARWDGHASGSEHRPVTQRDKSAMELAAIQLELEECREAVRMRDREILELRQRLLEKESS